MTPPTGDEYESNGSHLSLPELPKQSSPRRSIWPFVFAALLAMMAAGVLVLLTFGAFGFMLAVVAALFLFVGVHYFVWGRWLGDAIRRDVAEEEAAEAARRVGSPTQLPTEPRIKF